MEVQNYPFEKQIFGSLGFYQVTEKHANLKVWYVKYCYTLDKEKRDYLTIEWSAANCRYYISKDSGSIHNIPLFEGFIQTKEQLIGLLKMFDLKDNPFLTGEELTIKEKVN